MNSNKINRSIKNTVDLIKENVSRAVLSLNINGAIKPLDKNELALLIRTIEGTIESSYHKGSKEIEKSLQENE